MLDSSTSTDGTDGRCSRWSIWVDSSRNTWLCAAHHVPVSKHRPTIGQCRKVSFTAFDNSRPPFLPSRSRRDRLSSASTLRRRVLKDRRFHVVFRALYNSIQRWGKWRITGVILIWSCIAHIIHCFNISCHIMSSAFILRVSEKCTAYLHCLYLSFAMFS